MDAAPISVTVIMTRFKEILIYILSAVLCLLGGGLVIIVFLNESFNFVIDFTLSQGFIIVPKGGFYMFGGGVSLVTLGFIAVHEKLLRKKPSKNLIKVEAALLYGGFAGMLVLPHVLSYAAESKL